MALKTFTAKANIGAGTDALAAVDTPLGDAAAVALVTADGTLVDDASPAQVQDGATVSLLSRILNLLMSPMGFDRSLSRQRVTGIVESGALTSVTTVTTVTTVGAVTNLSTIDTIQGRLLPLNQNASAWAATVRSCIS
jgi:hypothetical protein